MAMLATFLDRGVLLLVAISAAALYCILLAVYRLVLSPVSKFPGPRIAALTFWYEFYYDVVCGGQYTFKIRKLHDQYGPIVRINPYELHIIDSDFYDVVYTSGSSKRDKWQWAAKLFGEFPFAGATLDHDLHRIRRTALNPFFSKQSIFKLEPVIRDLVARLCGRFEQFRGTGNPVNLGHAYAALTTDVITKYCFGRTYECIDSPTWKSYWPDTVENISQSCHLFKQFGWLLPVMTMLPDWMVRATHPGMMSVNEYQRDQVEQVKAIRDSASSEKTTTSNATIFHSLLNSNLPPEERTIERLAAEGYSVTAAGQVTTAYYLKTIHFHILDNPHVLVRLQAELQTVNKKGLPSLQTLEQLPYLTAVYNEGLRISYGVTSRLARIAPHEALQFHEWTIPPGTPISMTSIFMHDDPVNFPNPRVFTPERWLQPGAKRLEKYLVNFSKGSRGCAGLTLARAEIFLTLAAVFGGEFGWEVFETERGRDVDVSRDYFNPMPRKDSKGVRVLVV